MRYLGIDFGLKRIGLAITDSQGKVVLPLNTLKNDKNVLKNLKDLIEQRKVEAVVVGLPKDLNNRETEITKIVENFAKKLKKVINVPVLFHDERLTSFEAEQKLREAGIPIKKGKKYLDQLAATEILKSFLSSAENKSDY